MVAGPVSRSSEGGQLLGRPEITSLLEARNQSYLDTASFTLMTKLIGWPLGDIEILEILALVDAGSLVAWVPSAIGERLALVFAAANPCRLRTSSRGGLFAWSTCSNYPGWTCGELLRARGQRLGRSEITCYGNWCGSSSISSSEGRHRDRRRAERLAPGRT